MTSERVDGPLQPVAPPFESRARHSGRQRSESGAANQPTSRAGKLSHRRQADTWRPPPRLPIREDTRMRLIPSEHARIPFLRSTASWSDAMVALHISIDDDANPVGGALEPR